jgi:hypothetical protein
MTIITFFLSRQHSDQYADDVSRAQQDDVAMNENVLFSPAEHTDSLKRRKDKKKRLRLDKNATPRVKNGTQRNFSAPYAPYNPSSTASTPALTQPESRQGSSLSRQATPPSPTQRRPPKASETIEMVTEDEDVWYAKWWMFCFPDTVKSMTTKR